MRTEFTWIVKESDTGMDRMLEDLHRKKQAWTDQVDKVVQTCLK